MSQETVEVVRRVTDVMDAEGFEAALPVFLHAAHSDVEWREDPAWPGSANYRGVEQVRQVILDRMDTLDFDQQTEDLIPWMTGSSRSSVGVAEGRQAVRRAKSRWPALQRLRHGHPRTAHHGRPYRAWFSSATASLCDDSLPQPHGF